MTVDPTRLWPVFGLRLTCGDLELRVPDDELLLRLASLAAEGVHEPGTMPFRTGWTQGTPDEVARNVLRWHWRGRAELSPERFMIELAVLRDGVVVGAQGLVSERFAQRRTVETGSWLGLPFHGQGLGTRMRLAILHLAFDGLGADAAETAAFADNGPSNAISRRLRYDENGMGVVVRGDGSAVEERRYRLTRGQWERRPPFLRPDVTIEGLAPVRDLLGLGAAHPAAGPPVAGSSPSATAP